MLGRRQKAAAAELAQWWAGIAPGGIGSHAVLLAGPVGWGRSTVLDQLAEVIGRAEAPAGLVVRISGRSLPGEPGPQAAALREGLLGAGVRRQAAELLYRDRLRGAARLGAVSLIRSGMAGTISLLLAGLAAAAGGGVADDSPASENGAVARAARIVAAVSGSAPAVVIIDDADYLEPALAVPMIENLIDHGDSRILVVAAVDLGSDLAAALTARARRGRTEGRVHRAGTDPRMGCRSRAELAAELSPHLTAAEAERLARQTRTFAEVFAAARLGPARPTS
jgi:AAA ATPase domain